MSNCYCNSEHFESLAASISLGSGSLLIRVWESGFGLRLFGSHDGLSDPERVMSEVTLNMESAMRRTFLNPSPKP